MQFQFKLIAEGFYRRKRNIDHEDIGGNTWYHHGFIWTTSFEENHREYGANLVKFSSFLGTINSQGYHVTIMLTPSAQQPQVTQFHATLVSRYSSELINILSLLALACIDLRVHPGFLQHVPSRSVLSLRLTKVRWRTIFCEVQFWRRALLVIALLGQSNVFISDWHIVHSL